ncbi:MAG: two-component sensor histidine kinase [Flavobacteriaceae bacterium]|nr:two-component sensor histidine kinase [Flavobacteriaceae bacterium]
MVTSIIAVTVVQAYWISSAWENKEEEFSLAVSQSLKSVSIKVQEQEISDYIFAFQKLIDSVGTPNDSNFTDVFLFMDDDISSNLTSFYAFGILEEDYNINLSEFNPALLDENIKDYKKVKTTTILSKDKIFNRENRIATSINKLKTVERMSLYDQAIYRSAFADYSSAIPVHVRINSKELKVLLDQEFKDRNILTDYEFGIYNNGLATKIISNNYSEKRKGPKYEMPIFTVDKDTVSPYKLVVSFPERDQFVFSSIISVAGLSFFLTLFIIIVSSTAIYQIIRQKKVSEMKSDFINNMSHEFKTPIATINLALDAISSPKIQNSKNKLTKYIKMVREENQRMLSQVENVLMISRLEKSSSPIGLADIDLHDVIEDAVRHIDLIVKHEKGEINTFLNASKTIFKGNSNHFTNVIVNILDNAVKYSEKKPIIKIGTADSENGIELRIRDEGIGMDLATQKYIFQKFYRQQSGNIHNIKGHGLGLSYVKKIVEIHGGEILINSKVGFGSTFIIKLPSF